ncbi:hypothetical protein I302_106619 [Kwoniella bestiolae CBS 10118]|uniref:Pre-rRNA-processing protein n=1 Tax=Kwoniella bestiolae CBS 10118 TaxID=1296100 RepID=A0A1B9G0W8_9TREE|nr:pre-rRNA-processing protein IPI1 [Kwoniella bestiolae CBS 10118]OCF24658.1 pre-rRNA-processing protein IPI1 [Kwoniella bestiolae CBS 10118]
MPKATRKKKEKQADFTKAKLKLGKGKKQASNATDTSFKARSIALPGQQAISRAILNSDGLGPSEPTTGNGLTLEDLFIRFRHPNAGVRRESIGGVREILTIDVGRDIGKVLRALGGLVSDDDASVRKALIGLLAWYLPQFPVSTLSPHLPLLILQTSSSLSHIFPEIRLDACKLVHLLLNHVPSHIVGNWPREPSNILEGLRLAVGLGGEKGVNSQIGRLTGGAKLVTLRAMMEFVKRGLGKGDDADSTEWLDGWMERRDKGKGVDIEVREEPTYEDLSKEGWAVGSSWDLQKDLEGAWEVGRLNAQGKEDEDGIVSVLSQLYTSLHPLLLSTFLENAPTAFSPSSTSSAASTEDIPLALCTTTASLTEFLARAILTRSTSNPSSEVKEVRSSISDFLKRMAAWFPFSSNRLNVPTPNGLTAGFELSLVYSNLAVLLAPRPVKLVWPKEKSQKELGWREKLRAIESAWAEMRRKQGMRGKGKGKENADEWALEEVASWVVEVLAPKKDILSPSLTPAAYSAIIPIIFSLLTQPPSLAHEEEDIPSTVGEAFLSHLLRTSSTSSIRSRGDEFMIFLIEIYEQRYPKYPFHIPTINTILRDQFKLWFESIPKVLWELGNRDEEATERLLEFLLRLGSKGKEALDERYSILDGDSFATISSKLAPFFHLQHPSKGSIPGPWTKLSNQKVKKLGLDVSRIWMEWDDGRLRDATDRAVRGGEWEGYWSR